MLSVSMLSAITHKSVVNLRFIMLCVVMLFAIMLGIATYFKSYIIGMSNLNIFE